MQRKLLNSNLFIYIVIFITLIAISFFIKGSGVLARSYPPVEVDIKAKIGGTITVEGVTLIVSEGTFDEDVYFRVDKIARKNPISVNGLWQTTDIWEARVKFMSNSDQVNEYSAHKNYILAFPYTTQYLTTDQGVVLPQESLKLVRGETATGPWTVLNTSVVDQTNKTVAVITNRGGFFMVSGGFYQPSSNSQSSLKKNQPKNTVTPNRENTVVLKENEIIVTITPTQKSSPTPPVLPSVVPDNTAVTVTNSQNNNFNIFTAIYSIIQSFFQKL